MKYADSLGARVDDTKGPKNLLFLSSKLFVSSPTEIN